MKKIIALCYLLSGNILTANVFSLFTNDASEQLDITLTIPKKHKMHFTAKTIDTNDIHYKFEQAILNNCLSEVKKVITQGINIDQPFSSGMTPLYFAITLGHKEIALYLIHSNAKIDRPTVCLALTKNYNNIVQKMIRHRTSSIGKLQSHCAYAYHVLINNIVHPVKSFFLHCIQTKTQKLKPKKRDKAYIIAAIEILIQAGYNANDFWGSQLDGSFWLLDDNQASSDIINVLIKHNANPNHTFITSNNTHKTTTPLMQAIHSENIHAVKALLSVGADSNKRSFCHEYGQIMYPLTYALTKYDNSRSKKKLQSIISILIEYGAYV